MENEHFPILAVQMGIIIVVHFGANIQSAQRGPAHLVEPLANEHQQMKARGSLKEAQNVKYFISCTTEMNLE
jgi:hypothetical protein